VHGTQPLGALQIATKSGGVGAPGLLRSIVGQTIAQGTENSAGELATARVAAGTAARRMKPPQRRQSRRLCKRRLSS